MGNVDKKDDKIKRMSLAIICECGDLGRVPAREDVLERTAG